MLERYAYDPWGARRNPADWTQCDTRTGRKLNRGFTGHERLDAFGIINMNGRVYDPLTAQFFSPDPFIQEPENWYNYGRYAYCLNNPLRYTDPSGEKWWHWLLGAELLTGGFVSITATALSATAAVLTTTVASSMPAASVSSAWVRCLFDPSGATNQLNNAQRINYGFFKTDPNGSFGQRLWQITSRATWELPQTMAGYSYSHICNMTDNVDRVDYLGGATFVTNENAGKSDGVTLGNYININIEDEITGSFKERVLSDPLFMHEYGHTIDSRRYGLSYLFAIGMPSLFSAKNSENFSSPPFTTHRSFWTEVRANRNAQNYFAKHYNVDWNGENIYGHYRWISENGILVKKYYTINDSYPINQ